jgi:hypothetical protein
MRQTGNSYECQDCGHAFNSDEYAAGFRAFHSRDMSMASESFCDGWYAAYREHFDGIRAGTEYR